jgi:crotonobetainyl-CoA:carnitine CoA-transferase CaiB-like acyl-CoA transferase
MRETSLLPPVPFLELDKRPLAGIRVVELACVIAGPALGAALSASGADMIKVQSPNLPDLQVCEPAKLVERPMPTEQPSRDLVS